MHMLPRSFRLAVPMLLTLAVTAAAQVPAAPEPAPAAPPATLPAATQPATQPSTQPATRPAPLKEFSTTRAAATSSSTIKFKFKDTPVDNILDYLATSFDFILIKDSDTNRLTGRVTVNAPNDVTADEAVNILDGILKSYGLGLLRSDKVLHLMTRDKIKTLAPVFTGDDPDLIPPTDQMRCQIIPLVTLDPVRLKTDLQSMFSPDAEVVANVASNTLTVTDTAANIHHLVEVISKMDNQKIAASGMKVFKLKFANSTSTAKLINDIFGTNATQGGGQGGQGGGRGGQGGGGGGRGGQGGAGGGFPGFGGGGFGGGGSILAGLGGATPGATEDATAGKVNASSDDRTNTVVVTGPPKTLEVIDKEIIQKIDNDPSLDTTFGVYALKNASAANLQTVLNGLFGVTGGGSSSSSTTSTNGFQPLGSSSSSVGGGGGGRGGATTGGGGRGGTTGSTGSTGFGTTAAGGSTGSRTGSTGLGGTSGSSTSANGLVGQAFVVAEPMTNSLLVTVKTAYKDQVWDLIAKLDRDVPQVLIKVLVCEVTHTNSSDIGVDYQFMNTRPLAVTTAAGVAGTTQGGSIAGLDNGIAQLISSTAASGGPGGFAATIVEQNLSAALRAVASTGKLDVLSRPSILASDNQLASIMVGQLVPIITSSNITSVGNVVNSVTYQQVGIILNVTPHINPDGLVILDVAPTISQLSAQTVTVQAGVQVPVIDQRQAQSRVAIRNGQTIIIGGLMQDQKTETIDKIPLLGDIPWLGAAFSHTVESKTKTELLIFLTPQVAQSPDLLPGMTRDEKQATQLVPNAVAPGTFDEHMQGMSRGASKMTPTTPFPVVGPNDINHPAPAPTPPPAPVQTPMLPPAAAPAPGDPK